MTKPVAAHDLAEVSVGAMPVWRASSIRQTGIATHLRSDAVSLLIIGDTSIAGRTCVTLAALGQPMVHLQRPGDAELQTACTDPSIRGVAVLLHDDTAAARYVLAVEHLRPRIPIFVALFDRTTAHQLRRVVPNVTVTSPANVALPTLMGALMGDAVVAIGPEPAHDPTDRPTPGGGTERRVAVIREGQGLRVAPYDTPDDIRRRGVVGRLQGQFRPHDGNSAILLTGLLGMLAILVLDTLLSSVMLHRGFLDSLVEAVAVLSTVGPAPHAEGHPWYQVFAVVAMLSAIIFLAVFTAGTVEHLLSGRHVGLFGRRVLPHSGHVVVVGLGQVGMRLCQELRSQGVAVAALERDAHGRNLPIARAAGIPVLIGDGGMRRVQQRLHVDSCLAVAAVASDDLDNIAVSITARALAPGVPVVMRAGNDGAIAETASLFRIGSVVDVNGLTVSAVADWAAGQDPAFLADAGADIATVRRDGSVTRHEKVLGNECPHVRRT